MANKAKILYGKLNSDQYYKVQGLKVKIISFNIKGSSFSQKILNEKAEEASPQSCPFQIVHFARSSKASRSRKSSAQLSSNRLPPKTKKLRKMTLNPESIRQQQFPSVSSLQQHRGPGSTRPLIMEEQINIDDFLDLEPNVHQNKASCGWSKRVIQSNEIVGLQYVGEEEKHDFFKEI